MSKRWFVETTPEGRQQFVSIKRSRSYGGHHRRVREIDYIKVSLDEWNDLVEKERKLAGVNKVVIDECNTLNVTLATSQGETKRMSTVVIPRLEEQVATLTADNEALRRTTENAGGGLSRHGEEDKLRHRLEKLEKEKDDLKADNTILQEKNRSLSRQVEQSLGRRVSELIKDAEYWKHQSRSWRSRYEGLLKRYDDICDLLEPRTKKMRAYEEILQRRGII